ncbi:BON domain-containing protein [Coleofasciculus sp.]|uniref:BON domain-containing protein n=1 Tax=Coleofasciculus sp. TaxID=3100458 RepID=UPI003A459F6C
MVLKSDSELTTAITTQLHWDGRVNASKINVTVDHGVATLTGTVPHYRAKLAATEDAKLVTGVYAVDNQLQVEYPATTSIPPDSELASTVKTMLSWDADIDASNINVSVVDGIVTLRGTVDAYWKKLQAQKDVYWITGVIDVVNELGIVPTEKPQDEAIATTIETALERNHSVNVEDISVMVENGTVTLTGVVSDLFARDTAYNIAVYTPGVVNVIDQLTLEQQSNP